MKELLISTIIEMETEQHERQLNKNDMTRAELKLLERLLWKEMNMFGGIKKNNHESDSLYKTWKMVLEHIKDEIL